jgi:hypothetical protein
MHLPFSPIHVRCIYLNKGCQRLKDKGREKEESKSKEKINEENARQKEGKI